MRIAIVGCGPAGLFASIALHKLNFDVTLFEQFDAPAPVGSGLVLQPTGLAMLGAVGLRDRAEESGQRIDGMLGRLAPAGKVVLDIQYRNLNTEAYGVAIHRASLFQLLFDAVQTCGIPVHTGCRITSVSKTKDNRMRLVSDAKPVQDTFSLVIDASGANSKILQSYRPHQKRKALSFGALWGTVELSDFKPTVLEQRYVRANKMIGVLPCGTHPNASTPLATLFYSLEQQNYASWLANGLPAWKDEMRSLWPETGALLEQIDNSKQLSYASYSHHTLVPPYYGDGLMFIGDSAHATSPQLGQGVNMAFLDSLALAIAVNKYADNTHRAANLYTALRKRHVRFYQSVSYFMTPFYQSNSWLLPKLRDTFFEPVNSIGFASRFITALGAGMVLNPADKLVQQYIDANGQ